MQEVGKEVGEVVEAAEARSPTSGARRISDGIHSIMSRLNLSSRGSRSSAARDVSATERALSPLLLDLRCNVNQETALHAAARGKHWDITSALLQAGADPNVLAQEPPPTLGQGLGQGQGQGLRDGPGGGPGAEEEAAAKLGGGTTPLVEACRNRDIGMVDLMLRYGARDDDCRALRVAAGLGSGKEDILLAKLLSTKVNALLLIPIFSFPSLLASV